MVTNLPDVLRWLEVFEFSDNVFSADFLHQSSQKLRRQGLPTAKHEDWRYFPISRFIDGEFVAGKTVAASSNNAYSLIDNAADMIEVDVANAYVIGDLPLGLSIEFSADVEQLERGNRALSELVNDDALLLISQLCAHQVLSIKVDDTQVIDKPIKINFSCLNAAQLRSTQVLVQLGHSSQLIIIEDYAQSSAQTAEACCVFTNVGANAECQHYVLGSPMTQASYWRHSLTNVAADARYRSIGLLQGQRASRFYQVVNLCDKRAQVELKTAYSGGSKQVLDSRTQVQHLASHCRSNQVHHGLLDGEVVGGFTGTIYVAPEALQTEGQMDNRVLLLSDKAQNNSKPQLEIYADDVKCSHGFTCGRMDDRQLFYMQSRGIPLQLAKQQLIKAFLATVIDDFPDFLKPKT